MKRVIYSSNIVDKEGSSFSIVEEGGMYYIVYSDTLDEYDGPFESRDDAEASLYHMNDPIEYPKPDVKKRLYEFDGVVREAGTDAILGTDHIYTYAVNKSEAVRNIEHRLSKKYGTFIFIDRGGVRESE